MDLKEKQGPKYSLYSYSPQPFWLSKELHIDFILSSTSLNISSGKYVRVVPLSIINEYLFCWYFEIFYYL